jgi:hypothetical protein
LANRRSILTDANARAWRHFVVVFVAGLVASLGFVLATIILIDPYDTGYFPSLVGPGVVDDNDLTGTVGRGRDPRFDAAIFGNSHGLLLDPARLSPATGLSFVQLTTLGSGPWEQMALIAYFLRRHDDAKAIVIAADQTWCTQKSAPVNAAGPSGYRFPDWLFGESRLRYLANMLNSRPYGLVRRRILFAMGRFAPIDPAGVAAYPSNWAGVPPDALREPGAPVLGPSTKTSHGFPAIDRLDTLIAAIPDRIAVVVAMPPLYSELLPDAGTRQAAELGACKARLARAVTGRHGSAFLDFLVDSPLSRDRANFLDLHHMREPAARAMETQIADTLNSRRQGSQ